MAQETHEVTIDGIVYSVQQIPSRRALKLFNRLVRLCAPAAAGAVQAVQSVSDLNNLKLSELNVGALVGSIGTIFERLTDAEFDNVCKELLTGARIVEGEDVADPDISKGEVFDQHFKGRLENVYTLLHFALKANYGNFFVKLVAAIGRLSATTSKKPSISPTT